MLHVSIVWSLVLVAPLGIGLATGRPEEPSEHVKRYDLELGRRPNEIGTEVPPPPPPRVPETNLTRSIESAQKATDKRRGLFIDDDNLMEMRGNVRQDIYNYYNINQRPERPQRQPYQYPYYRPPPGYDYDNSPDYAPYYWPRPPPPFGVPNYPLPYTPAVSTTTTTTTAPPSSQAAAISPLGYMLIDSYKTPFGSYSRPIAFFKS